MRLQRVDFESSPALRNNYSRGSGAGVGTFFKSLYRTLLPLAKKASNLLNNTEAGQAIKAVAVDTGMKVARDVLAGEKVSSAIKKNVEEPIKNVKRTAMDAGLDIITDTLKGKNLKEAAKERITQASKKLKKMPRSKKGRGGKKAAAATKRGGKKKKRAAAGGCGGSKKVGKKKGGRKRKVVKSMGNGSLGKQLVRQWL